MIPCVKKNLSAYALAVGLFCFLPQTASAASITYSDVDVINFSLAAGTATAVYEGQFNFEPPDTDANIFTATGFGPASGTYVSSFGYQLGKPITGGTISFFFRDPDSGIEAGSITANFASVGAVPSFATYSVFSQGLDVTILTSIALDGVLHYMVTANNGDFELVAGVGTITVRVPDTGSTLTLFGGSLLGLAALKRHLNRRARRS